MLRYSVLAPVVVLLLSACSVDLKVATDSMVTCSDASPTCPSGFICRTAIERCVSVDASDAAPAVQSASVTPSRATVGGVVTAVVTANAALLEPPTVVLGTPGRPAMVLQGQSGLTYTYMVSMHDDGNIGYTAPGQNNQFDYLDGEYATSLDY